MEYSGAGGKLIHEKNQKQKSRDTVPLMLHNTCYSVLYCTYICSGFVWMCLCVFIVLVDYAFTYCIVISTSIPFLLRGQSHELFAVGRDYNRSTPPRPLRKFFLRVKSNPRWNQYLQLKKASYSLLLQSRHYESKLPYIIKDHTGCELAPAPPPPRQITQL